MSEGKKPSLLDRWLGGDQPKKDEPAEPTKKAPPSREPAREEPPRESPVEDEPPERKPPPKRAAEPPAAPEPAPKRSWFAELRRGLARTSTALCDNLACALTKSKLDDETLDQLEEALIKADLGVAMAGRIRQRSPRPPRAGAFAAGVARGARRRDRQACSSRVAKPLTLDASAHPHVSCSSA